MVSRHASQALKTARGADACSFPVSLTSAGV